jgi:glutathione S-transferase
MTAIILHQYDASPFSEKVRVALGIKGLAWQACDQPMIMPKPDLVPLTGGYRRIPVMQIGADIYCDSVLILAELERRHPVPTLFPARDPGMAIAGQYWTDRELFQAAVVVIFGGLGDRIDPAFAKDREALSGRPFDAQAMKAAVPVMADQLVNHAALIELQLGDGRAFLDGPVAGLADAAAYYNFWFVAAHYPPAMALFDAAPRLNAWIGRVRDIGHGARSAVTPARALELARASEPDPTALPEGTHPFLGERVSVFALDYGRDPIEGTLVGAGPFQLSLRREDPVLGTLMLHTPRIGYGVAPRSCTRARSGRPARNRWQTRA